MWFSFHKHILKEHKTGQDSLEKEMCLKKFERLRLAKVVKPTYRQHTGARVNAALLTYLLKKRFFKTFRCDF